MAEKRWVPAPLQASEPIEANAPAVRRSAPALRDAVDGLSDTTPLLAVLLVALTWPITSIAPEPGPDPSWQAGLYMALGSGLQFGRDVVFTYGPLGFLHSPVLFSEGLFLVSFGFNAFVRIALVTSLLWTARRALPLPLAVAACYVILVVGHLNATLVLVVFLWAFAATGEESPAFAPSLLVFGGGLLGAVELLSKVNFGVSVLALTLLALCALPERRRRVPAFAGVFVASLTGLWLITGQTLDNLPDYLSHSAQIVSGYSQAMGSVNPASSLEVAVAIVGIGLLLTAAAFVTRGASRAKRLASCALVLLFALACFKQDFVREGRADFAVMMACAAIAIASRASTQPAQRLLAAAVIVPMIALLVWWNPAPTIWQALRPQDHVTQLRQGIDAISNPKSRQETMATSRSLMRHSYSVPSEIRGRIGQSSVAIEPWEIGVAWAYGLKWKPLPVIQDYAAYTPALDQLNASALAGDGPDMILRQGVRGKQAAATVANVDNRYPAWDAPAAKLSLICNYREARTSGDWQLLERDTSRCGPSRALGTTKTDTGEPIKAPTARDRSEIVFAHINGLGNDTAEAAETLLYRQPNRWVSFDAGRRWNLTSATAGDGLILSAPRAVDYRRPFQLAPNPKTFAVGIDGAGPRPIEVSFFSRRVRPEVEPQDEEAARRQNRRPAASRNTSGR